VAQALGQRDVRTFVDTLADHGDRPALVSDDGCVTYAELAQRVEHHARRYGSVRRLVLLEMANAVDCVVAYLGALRARQVVMLTDAHSPDRAESLRRAYAPDVALRAADRWDVPTPPPSSRHALHDDLALLLSTSGSTGSAKLVRLSYENVDANARSIAEYLELSPDDRAITTLPLHYCYGLSVLHSHLAVGASVVVDDRSVTDPGFWSAFERHRATSFAGVPHTFRLLRRIGFERMRLPSLRYVTQAGGKLDAAHVAELAELGARSGWELFVMYGQTEATARMAYLPPHLAASHPSCIGRAVPGGRLRIDPDTVDGDGVGELLYAGPNVMLGYAEHPHDLALGRTVDELRTGDLARVVDGDLFEVVGRRTRFVKPFGLRIDLDELERCVAASGLVAACAGDDDGIVVAVEGDAATTQELLLARTGLPPTHLRVVATDAVPRLANGKVDYVAVRAMRAGTERAAPRSVRALYRELLGVTDVRDDDTFVGLGGDSLTYVQLSVELEVVLGDLPTKWETLPVGELEQRAMRKPAGRRRTHRVETNVVLRAVAITLVVGTHAGLFRVQGGAHLLFAIAGFNFARFALQHDLADTATRIARSAWRIAAPSMVWIGLLLLTTDDLDRTNLVLAHGLLGGTDWDERWRYWFIEVIVQTLLVLAAVFGWRRVRECERRAPFAFACGAVAVGLALRFAATWAGTSHPLYRPHTIFWLFALGWAAERARGAARRSLVLLVAVATLPGYFGEPTRDAVVLAGLVALLVLPTVRVPRVLHLAFGRVAAASLYAYLTNAKVYPHVVDRHGALLATVAALFVGIIVADLATRVSSALRAPARRRDQPWSELAASGPAESVRMPI
jgi:acyl-CoA synthetase (AMP-forming)/AMP-acid ligase II